MNDSRWLQRGANFTKSLKRLFRRQGGTMNDSVQKKKVSQRTWKTTIGRDIEAIEDCRRTTKVFRIS